MRARWNETTGALLTALLKGKAAVEDLSKALKAAPTTVGTVLLRLYRAKNVDREKIEDGVVVIDAEEEVTRPRHVYVYSITEKGKARLAWIRKSRKSK